jgi:hypothetical protein
MRRGESLLKTEGFQSLLDVITPEEIVEAKELLKDFLNFFPTDDDKFALAYLFGILQGAEDTYGDFSASGQGIFCRMKEVHELGRKLGTVQGMIFYQQQEKKRPSPQT